MSDVYLIYKGGSFLSNIPARDLTHDEAKKYGIAYLLKSGLYKLAKKKNTPKKDGE